jgi:hypothetical protein
LDILPGPVKNFIDAIFSPPVEFLSMVIGYLNQVSMIAGKGINLGQYLSFFNYLPSSLQVVVTAIVSSIIFLAILQIVKSIMRMYYAVKAAVKWW